MSKELKNANMPSRPPIISTLVVWMALDHWHAPMWLYGALGTLYLFIWVGLIYAMFSSESVDIIARVEALEKQAERTRKFNQ